MTKSSGSADDSDTCSLSLQRMRHEFSRDVTPNKMSPLQQVGRNAHRDKCLFPITKGNHTHCHTDHWYSRFPSLEEPHQHLEILLLFKPQGWKIRVSLCEARTLKLSPQPKSQEPPTRTHKTNQRSGITRASINDSKLQWRDTPVSPLCRSVNPI